MNLFKEFVEPLLTVLAIVFSIIQFFDSLELKKKIKEVVKSMTTRYVGMFPENFAELNELVPQAKKSLSILIDYAGYGHYGDPIRFDSYINLLRMRKPDLKKRIILYNSFVTKHIFMSREFTEETWAEMRVTEQYHDFFSKGFCPSAAKEPATLKDFQAIMLKNLAYYMFELQRSGFEIRTVRSEQSIFTWIADDLDAVVTFRSQRKDDTEAAFRTRDTKLLSTLSVLFENVWSTADPLPTLESPPEEWGVDPLSGSRPASVSDTTPAMAAS